MGAQLRPLLGPHHTGTAVPTVTLGILLNVAVQELTILPLEFKTDFQHVHFTLGYHDANSWCSSWSQTNDEQSKVACPECTGPGSEGIFHLSFGLLDALPHVIRAVALTPFEYFLEVAHSGLSHDVYPLGSISSICHHPSIIELPSIYVSQVCHQLNYPLLFCPFGSYQMCWKWCSPEWSCMSPNTPC